MGSWSGTDNDGSTSTSNSLTMPANSHTVSVTYVALSAIQPGIWISATVGSSAEQDTYRFEATFAQWISVRMFGEGSLDPYLRLRDNNGVLLTSDDNGAQYGTAAFFTYPLLGSGPYQIVASGSGATTGGYRLGLAMGRSAGIGDINHDCTVSDPDMKQLLNCWGRPIQGACSDADTNVGRHQR